MDIGDLLFLIFIALGALSSLFGAKKSKKAPPARRPRPVPDRSDASGPREAGESAPPPPPPASEVRTEMERILSELGLQTRPPPPPPPPPVRLERDPSPGPVVRPEVRGPPAQPQKAVPPAPRRVPPPVERPFPVATSLESLEGLTAQTHQAFHDRYIRPLPTPGRSTQVSRARRFLNPRTLRGAILAKEILDQPKGLQ